MVVGFWYLGARRKLEGEAGLVVVSGIDKDKKGGRVNTIDSQAFFK